MFPDAAPSTARHTHEACSYRDYPIRNQELRHHEAFTWLDRHGEDVLVGFYAERYRNAFPD